MKVLNTLTMSMFFAAMMMSGCAGSKWKSNTNPGRVVADPCAKVEKLHGAIIPVPRDHKSWMVRHQQILERIRQQDVQMIFIGNSITQRWEKQGVPIWNEYYGNRKAVNMGFDGDGTQNVLWRLEHGEIDSISPKIAIVMIGSNHVNGYKTKEIAEGIKAVCCSIRSKLPGTKILLMAILPRGDASAAAAYRLRKASEEASKIADDQMIYYLDISEQFLDEDGNISTDLITKDGVHLSQNGYRKLAEGMEPVIERILANR